MSDSEIKKVATVVVLRPFVFQSEHREVGEVITMPFAEAYQLVNSNRKNPKALPYETEEEIAAAGPRVEAKKRALQTKAEALANRAQPSTSGTADPDEVREILKELLKPIKSEITKLKNQVEKDGEAVAERLAAVEEACEIEAEA